MGRILRGFGFRERRALAPNCGNGVGAPVHLCSPDERPRSGAKSGISASRVFGFRGKNPGLRFAPSGLRQPSYPPPAVLCRTSGSTLRPMSSIEAKMSSWPMPGQLTRMAT